MSKERCIPIFPLNAVLFPGVSMPIHIFEERYKRMIQECLDSTSDFGVALIETGSEVGEPAVPCSTGTLVDIVEVNKVNGGRMFISV